MPTSRIPAVRLLGRSVPPLLASIAFSLGAAAQPAPTENAPAPPAPPDAVPSLPTPAPPASDAAPPPPAGQGKPSDGATAPKPAEAAEPPSQKKGSELAAQEEPVAKEEEERAVHLPEQAGLFGSTGLLHTSHASSGAEGTFRVGVIANYFSATGFLCRPTSIAYPAGNGRKEQKMVCGTSTSEDDATRIGGLFSLNATPLPWLEAYATIKAQTTSNDQSRPSVLNSLGNTTLGVKGFLPPKLGRVFSVGGDVQLQLLSQSAGAGVSGAATGALFRLMGTADLRKPGGAGFPFRTSLNLGYKVDNSAALVESAEARRGVVAGLGHPQAITRIERFGLNINKVDSFQTYLGLEFPLAMVQPFAEWTVDIPVNRQNYICHASSAYSGDLCLSNGNFNAANPKTVGGPGFGAIPSRFTIGARTNPFPDAFRGLSALLAFDIATSGNSTFIEEVAPEPPWMMYFGLGFAFDTARKEVVPPPPPPPPPAPVVLPQPQTLVRGLVHEQGKTDVVVDAAVVSIEGVALARIASDPDGRFTTKHLEPGNYTLRIKADGFRPGTCVVTVPAPVKDAPPLANPPKGEAEPNPAGPAAPAPKPPIAPPPSVTYVDVDCPLEAIPKLGSMLGTVRDAETGAIVGNASLRIVDANGKESTVHADGVGAFVIRDLAPGTATVTAEGNGYMSHSTTIDVRANEEVRPTITLTKRPKVAQVKVEGKEIRITKQIHFETDSAKIMGDSNALLEEIADVIQHNTHIRKLEIQGHTDNSGTQEHNLELSTARANAVRSWLSKAGVDHTRLVAKGYGQTKPIAPNVSAASRARNRRVQFVILEGAK